MKYAVVGYGKLGKACEQLLIEQNHEVRVFSRRLSAPSFLPALPLDELSNYQPSAALLCISSAQDAFTVAPQISALCPTVDCYDNHSLMNEYLSAINAVATSHSCVCGAGWEPGIFSVLRRILSPLGNTHTFYGEGVSLGHSNAARTIEGVRDAVAYTLPLQALIAAALNGGEVKPDILTHTRRVCILPNEGADRGLIASALLAHPYFSSYSCDIVFCEQEQFDKVRYDAFHQGKIITVGDDFTLTFALSARSNASLTARVMISVLPILPLLSAGAHLYPSIPPALFSSALI